MKYSKYIAFFINSMLIGKLYFLHTNHISSIGSDIILYASIILLTIYLVFSKLLISNFKTIELLKNIAILSASALIPLLAVIFYNQLKNTSVIVLSASQYDGDSLCLDLRENETYRMRYTHGIVGGGHLKYGKYQRFNDMIKLDRKVNMGIHTINDSLYIEDDRISISIMTENDHSKNNISHLIIMAPKETCCCW